MSTATEPENARNGTFYFFMRPDNPTAQYYVYMHFAEVEKLQPNQSRAFYIFQNEEFWNGNDQPMSPNYLSTTTAYSILPVSGERIEYYLIQSNTSTHQPILNALEVYIVQNFSEPQTDEKDGMYI